MFFLLASALLVSGSTVFGAAFTSEESEIAEEAVSGDETEISKYDTDLIFDDGTSEILEPSFSDTASAQTISPQDIPLDEAHFPNKFFRNFLASKDLNKNGILDMTEITEITSITREDIGDTFYLMSMEGYEYLTSLETLHLTIEQYELPKNDLVLDFASLTHLKKLTVSVEAFEEYSIYHEYEWSNSLPTVLNLTDNAELTELHLTCDVKDIQLPKDCHIQKISDDCWEHSQPESIGHNHGTNDLQILNLISQITSLEQLKLEDFQNVSLNTSEIPHLRIVDISNCQNLKLDFSQNPDLEVLRLYEVQLMQDELDLGNCHELQTIDFQDIRSQSQKEYEHNFSMIDLGDCHPRTVNVTHSKMYWKISPSGYIDFSENPGWNPARIVGNYENPDFRFVDSKLFPLNMENASKNESYRKVGEFRYALNKDKTAFATVPLQIQEIHNPEMVTGLKITQKTTSSISCKWNPVKRDHDGYVVYVLDPLTGKNVKRIQVSKSTTSKTITGLKAGQRCQVMVRAYCKYNGKNYYSAHYEGNVFCFTVPKTPSPKAQNIAVRKVKLTWKKTPTAYRKGWREYIIYYRNSKSKDYQELARVSDTTEQFTTKALKKNNTYYFKIRSVISDKGGYNRTYGAYSKEVKVKINK